MTHVEEAVEATKNHIEHLKRKGVYCADKEKIDLANHLTTLLDELDKNRWISCDDFKPAEDEFIVQYLHNKAAEILFSEGMAVKIGQKVNDHFSSQARNSAGANIYDYYGNECDWWRTVTPEKVLNIWLELDDD